MSVNKSEYERRRARLMEHMESNSIAVIPAAREVIRSRDTHYIFRQDSDFSYLSGFPEPDAVMVLIPEREHGEYVLFVRDKDKEREIWDGYRSGPAGAVAEYAADDAFPIDDIDDILPGLIEGRERVYYSLGRNQDFDTRVMAWINTIRAKVRAGATPPGEFLDLDHILHDMRLFKSAEELRLMARAGEISAEAHCKAMSACQPGMYEYQLEAIIQHHCAMNGAVQPAYSPIVGGGANACVLHYIENSKKLKASDLVLIDAGCEYEGYAGDITRTFPVSGKFSAEQRALYDIVLEAQLEAIKDVRVGGHWNVPHETSVRVITQGLIDLGLLKGSLDENLEQEAHQSFYMHRVGHWLGLDVHDVGDYKVHDEWRVLEPGMVMTVEPGIYVAPDNTDVPAKWRGIGIRIEDDVVVTKDGPKILTSAVPKHPDEIEALVGSEYNAA
jgi:Xaa-Pro aminopeptidase